MAIGGRAARPAAALCAASPLRAGQALAATPAANLFYERALMAAADGACRLFAPDVSAALAASKAQARGAALRSGADAAALAGLEAQASAAGAAGCGSPASIGGRGAGARGLCRLRGAGRDEVPRRALELDGEPARRSTAGASCSATALAGT